MKYRFDFVTNSSSSSYIAFSLKSSLLAPIIEEGILKNKDNDNASAFWRVVKVEGDTITFSDEGPDWTEYYFVPREKEDVLTCVMSLLKELNGFDRKEDHTATTELLKLLDEEDPVGVAESITMCKWEGETGGYGEAMNDFDGGEESYAYTARFIVYKANPEGAYSEKMVY